MCHILDILNLYEHSIVSLFSPESMILPIRHKLICSPNEEWDTSLKGHYQSLNWSI